MSRDRSLFIAGGGSEDFGLNKVKFSRSLLWMLLHWGDPPNKFWWLSRSRAPPPPPMPSYSRQIWVAPLWIFPKFSAISPFILPIIKWSLLKSPQAITNDRSLSMRSGRCSLWWPIRGGAARKGYLFRSSGIWKGRGFPSWSIWKDKEICHCRLWNDLKELTDTFGGCVKDKKTS